MPNWVKCKVSPKRDFDKVKKYVLDECGEFDFNRIIPEPLQIEQCEKQYILGENQHIEKEEDRPWFNWYDWHIDKWGTKWNSAATEIGDSYIAFETAWSAPFPIMEALSTVFEDVSFVLEYADEDIGYNCGTVEFENGKVTQDILGDEEFANDL